MDNVQTINVGPRLCAIMLGMTVGSLSPAMAANHNIDLSNAAKKWEASAFHSTYWATGLQSGSQSTHKIVNATHNVGSDNFFLGFGKRFDSQQVVLSSDDHQLIWDNLDYLLS
jgi:hypothetical protein